MRLLTALITNSIVEEAPPTAYGGGGRGEGQEVCTEFFSLFLRLMNTIRAMEGVKYVERNQIMEALQACELQKGTAWGLVRTTRRYDWDTDPHDPPNEYSYNKEGTFIQQKLQG